MQAGCVLGDVRATPLASWHFVAEESSSVRADACSRRVVGALIGAKIARLAAVSILGCSRARWLLSAKRPSACTKRAPRALKPRLIIPHTPNNAAPRNKTARAAAPRAHRHDLRHDGISAVLNSARAAVEPRASLRTALPRPVASLPSRRAPKKSRSRAARAAPTDKKT